MEFNIFIYLLRNEVGEKWKDAFEYDNIYTNYSVYYKSGSISEEYWNNRSYIIIIWRENEFENEIKYYLRWFSNKEKDGICDSWK